MEGGREEARKSGRWADSLRGHRGTSDAEKCRASESERERERERWRAEQGGPPAGGQLVCGAAKHTKACAAASGEHC